MLNSSISRLIAAINPSETVIKDFVLEKTRLNGRRFSLKNHEYQEIVLDTCVNPDANVVIQKPSQIGLSEIIYRLVLAIAANISGFSASVVFPSVTQASEIFKTRIDPIINSCDELKRLRDYRVDSSFLKMFLNNSILYALGASPQSKSTVITRPIRMVLVDEVARCDTGIISSMRSRQRHQLHKATILFSTPLFENFDIDAEMGKCGIIWEAILKCEHCNHEFFPEFYDHIRLPNYSDPIRQLTLKKIEKYDLDVSSAYLECPKCERKTSYGYPHTRWVNTCDKPNRPKTGIRISAFEAPAFVTVPDMITDYVLMDDKNEFDNQVRGKPASTKNTAIDISQVTFITDPVPSAAGSTVFGLDIGKISWLTVGKLDPAEERLFIHTILPIKLKELKATVQAATTQFKTRAGIIDYMPYTDVTTEFIKKIHNSWAALYYAPTIPQPELFKLKMKDDEALGPIRMCSINMNPAMDFFATQIVTGGIVYKSSALDSTILEHLQGMRKVRDYRYEDKKAYKWVKPQRIGGQKVADHIFHSSLYCMYAARLLIKNKNIMSLPVGSAVSSFKLKVNV